jgi:hypothetical protein
MMSMYTAVDDLGIDVWVTTTASPADEENKFCGNEEEDISSETYFASGASGWQVDSQDILNVEAEVK